MYGLRRSLLPGRNVYRRHDFRLPAAQSGAGGERSGVSGAVGTGLDPAVQNPLPSRVHLPGVSGAVRSGLYLRPARGSGIHEGKREGCYRIRFRQRPGEAGCPGAHAQEGGGDRQRPRRTGSRAPAEQEGTQRYGVRAQRPARRTSALRHSQYEAGKIGNRPADPADGGIRHPVLLQYGRRKGYGRGSAFEGI